MYTEYIYIYIYIYICIAVEALAGHRRNPTTSPMWNLAQQDPPLCSATLLVHDCGNSGNSLEFVFAAYAAFPWFPGNCSSVLAQSHRSSKSQRRHLQYCWLLWALAWEKNEATHPVDQSLRPDDGWVHFRVFLGQLKCCYINGHHKQYILLDTIFNYVFHFGLPGICLYLSPQNIPFWRRRSRHWKGYYPEFSKDMFLEVQNEKCS